MLESNIMTRVLYQCSNCGGRGHNVRSCGGGHRQSKTVPRQFRAIKGKNVGEKNVGENDISKAYSRFQKKKETHLEKYSSPKWEEYEKKVFEWVEKKFGELGLATFERCGGSDSTKPDIHVVLNDGTSFYIEVKSEEAQCGQFVAVPEDGKFVYSKRNASSVPDSNARRILEHLDSNFDKFSSVDTDGAEIVFPDSEKVFASWVIDSYRKKGVKFFITGEQDDYSIIPIEDFDKHFVVSGMYRQKKSGSGIVGKTASPQVREYVRKNYVSRRIKEKDGRIKLFSTEL